ncbi:Anti-sigma F factor antagonist (spoIIAA-2) Anti-sigma B factor antagonist RsbV [Paramagnetospirillum magnetotacticum MS-1]|uniref:Anti-sigma factor antagonist n=1 Tax=Paramagnetospirillum magnetotacticum MS-1 TaxID=272627 RepID=A0A0C2YSW6_PARME|nr:STAS domain-containing protein [Paramagnetospirillum magnetotacticum]KIL98228.1 Anti-sigma F factor antagonist (spoIIAA-2) Anti-sigma B factor antagonist RsbV [Paramagnetospirillum magnetotacticum MS-1]
MKIETRAAGASTIMTLSGEVDLRHSPTLRKALMDLMLEKRPVAVDLSRVEYIDSSGIAGLVEAYQMARKNDTRFVLAAISDPVRRVLQLSRLDRVFTIADTLDSALEG